MFAIQVDFPFILSNKLSLREYQHVGLNWLVSLHERRLNGILADGMKERKYFVWDLFFPVCTRFFISPP